MPIITVVGSLNVDMVTITSRVPEGGETILAKSFDTGWGGKGANQAVAAARLSRSQNAPKNSTTIVRMAGAVGNDVFGPQMIKSLEEDGIDASSVRKLDGFSTGTAVILVEEDSGENRILVTAGANFGVDTSTNLVAENEFGDVAVFQLETPMDVVVHNIRLAHAGGTRVVLNPAPAQTLPEDIYPELTWLIMNETEAAISSSQPPESVSASSNLDNIARIFIDKGVANVIITLGGDGAYYQTATRHNKQQPGRKFPAAKAKVVDTTAAGDTFVGAFAVKLAEAVARTQGQEGDEVFDDAITFAIRAAGKTVEKSGAQKSIPWADEVAGS